MATLHLEESVAESAGHEGEVLACAFTPDNSCLMTTGWDGNLCLWDTAQAAVFETIKVDEKPVSACCASPDNKHWLVGTMDGMLGQWDAEARVQVSMFLAHTRPVSTLTYSPDGRLFASASWDRTIQLWNAERPEPGPALGNHSDIVSGCSFVPDGKRLISWSYDGAAIGWDLHERQPAIKMEGHSDRITAGSVSPDGQWLVTGARNGELKLWELQYGQEVNSLPLQTEIRSCCFLLDAESIVVADARGQLFVLRLPHLEILEECQTGKAIQCMALAASGAQIALGDADGHVSIVTVEGFDAEPLAITAVQTLQDTSKMLHRMFGQSRHSIVYECSCPACRAPFQLSEDQRRQVAHCPQCHRAVRVCAVVKGADAVLG